MSFLNLSVFFCFPFLELWLLAKTTIFATILYCNVLSAVLAFDFAFPESHWVAQVDLKLSVLPLLPPEYSFQVYTTKASYKTS